MEKLSINKDTKILGSVIILMTIIFLSLITVDESLIYGWLIGTAIFLAVRVSNYVFLNLLFEKKIGTSIWSFAKLFTNFVIVGSSLIFIISINRVMNYQGVFTTTTENLNNPINLIVFIAAYAVLNIIDLQMKLHNTKEHQHG